MTASHWLPPAWAFEGLEVADVRMDEIELVERLHRSRADLATVDPSFKPVEFQEYASLVNASNRSEAEGFPFRLQIFRESGAPCGYYHAYGHHPRPGCFFISMFFIVPERSREGLGSRAVAGIIRQAKSLGFERTLLTVFLANRDALAFWIGQGFDRIEKFRKTEETGQPDRLILEFDLAKG